MKNLKNGLYLLSLICAFLMLHTLSSCQEETKTFETFSASYNSVSPSIQLDVLAYVEQRCNDFNKAELGENMEQSDATKKFKSFCPKLVNEVKEKGYKIFADTWVNLQLVNIKKEVVSEIRVNFEKTADAKYYVQITFTETAPTGNTETATTFIEGILNPFSLKKETITENKITSNIYRFYKEYSSVDEAKNYYKSKEEDLKKVIDKIEKEWPSNILYTGKVQLTCLCIDEKVSIPLGKIDNYYIVHKPNILGTWTTTSANAPFTSTVFGAGANVPSPIFVNYKMTIDGKATDYVVVRAGQIIGVMTGSTFKYMFSIKDTNNFTLIEQDGVEVKNGATYTYQKK